MDLTKRSTGVDQPVQRAGKGPKSRARCLNPGMRRTGLEWSGVVIKGNESSSTPQVSCKFCGKIFSGGATRIREHFLGGGNVEECRCETEEYCNFKDKLQGKNEQIIAQKRHREAVEAVDRAASGEGAFNQPLKKQQRQRSIESSLAVGGDKVLDSAIAELFYGCNLNHRMADSPLFKRVITLAKTASEHYKPPDRKRLGNDLLFSTTERLQREQSQSIENVRADGLTIVSDGWDDVQHTHLINLLLCHSKGAFFKGTIALTSKDSEDAKAVCDIISSEIERAGKYNIVQVCTDTCSTMKAAWRLIESRYPWITCTCCATHVLSLYLKDLAKIPEVKTAIDKTHLILNRFWGRQRWPRNKLREVAMRRHGKPKIGLYRAKQTRFAGKVQEMARALRLQDDLQEVVLSSEYAEKVWLPLA